MPLITVITLLLPYLNSADAATIAQIIAGRADLSKMAALAANHPEWSGADPITVFVPTDAALAAGAANLPPNSGGFFTVGRVVDWSKNAQYEIMTDVTGKERIVYDNYRQGQATPEVHMRYGVGDAISTDNIKADNGWVYVMNKVIEPSYLPTVTLGRRPENSKFLELIKQSGLQSYVDGLQGVTIFPPTDGAMTAAQGTLAGLTQVQKQAIVMAHISSQLMLSTAVNSGPIPSQYGQNPLIILVGNEQLSVNGSRIFPSDITISTGMMHQLEQVIIPPVLPSASQSLLPIPVSATTRPAASATSSATGAKSAADARAVPFIYFSVALMSVLYFML